MNSTQQQYDTTPSVQPVNSKNVSEFAPLTDLEKIRQSKERMLERFKEPVQCNTTETNSPSMPDIEDTECGGYVCSSIITGQKSERSGSLILPDAALYGLAGDIVRSVTKGTEADPAGTLAHLMVRFGIEAGPDTHILRGYDKHPGRLFAVFVGDSSTGAKGTSSSPIEHIFAKPDPSKGEAGLNIAERPHLENGLSSGQGLISAVRDTSKELNEKGKPTYEGEREKRLFIYEKEFGRALSSMAQQNNILPNVLDCAWDGDILGDLTKNSRQKATGAHVGLVGHITPEELHEKLKKQPHLLYSGLGNRILWVHTEVRDIVPNPPILPQAEIDIIRRRIEQCIDKARAISVVCFSPVASKFYEGLYRRLKSDIGNRSRTWKSVSDRALAQICRIALIYALFDEKTAIGVEHLIAAKAFWDYCDESAALIFGGKSDNPDHTKLLRALQSGTMSRTEINRLFGGRKSPTQLDSMTVSLLNNGSIFKQGNRYVLARSAS